MPYIVIFYCVTQINPDQYLHSDLNLTRLIKFKWHLPGILNDHDLIRSPIKFFLINSDTNSTLEVGEQEWDGRGWPNGAACFHGAVEPWRRGVVVSWCHGSTVRLCDVRWDAHSKTPIQLTRLILLDQPVLGIQNRRFPGTSSRKEVWI